MNVNYICEKIDLRKKELFELLIECDKLLEYVKIIAAYI